MGMFGSLFGRNSSTDQSSPVQGDQSSGRATTPSHGLMDNPWVRAADVFLLGGAGSQLVRNQDRRNEKAKLRGLFNAMPQASGYAPQGTAPLGDDGKPLEDPLAAVPYDQRMRTWLGDVAAAGGDVPLTALMPKDRQPQILLRPDGSLVAIGDDLKMTPIAGPVAKADPYEELRAELLKQQIAATGALTGQRQHAAARPYFAPPRGAPKSGGGAAPTQPSSARRINSQAEFAALPSGSTFIAPDGTTRRKP